MSTPIYDGLIAYQKQEYYPWHMPGHKRHMPDIIKNPYNMDYTEVPGLDNLHAPQEMIYESLQQAALIYGSVQSYYLINGSTAGILTAISSVASPNNRIIMARNCHKAVYHVVQLLELDPIYLYPNIDEKFNICEAVTPEQVEQALLLYPEAVAVVLTSPTYEGVLSDIKAIAQVVHEYGRVLIVDEAHGAHLEYIEQLPKSAVRCGADLVIQSLHKTLPALTQTAILHICSRQISKERVERYLQIYQTSSPSYVLMASIDYAIDWMHSQRKQACTSYYQQLMEVRTRLEGLEYLQLYKPNMDGNSYYDIGKIVIGVPSNCITGIQLANMLQENYKQVVEMAAMNYIVFMTSVMDTEESLNQLYLYLSEIDQQIKNQQIRSQQIQDLEIENQKVYKSSLYLQRADVVLSCKEAYQRKREVLPIEECIGKVAGEFVYLYPPGIPILVPGEKITKEIIRGLNMCITSQYNVLGVDKQGCLWVIVE